MQYQDEEESMTGDHKDMRLRQPEFQARPVEVAGKDFLNPPDDHLLNLPDVHLRNPDSDHESAPLQYDPWSALLHAQGIEVVDLQQIRSRIAQEPVKNFDVEQALDIMQERPAAEP
ncbi:MAG TPA: hypothetical protein VKV20_11600 [Ktedonobacteraceae bacterium]|jgi:hypothetical protein|nr:hypothetical protein [Ktedonobacteraceae bacterium]